LPKLFHETKYRLKTFTQNLCPVVMLGGMRSKGAHL